MHNTYDPIYGANTLTDVFRGSLTPTSGDCQIPQLMCPKLDGSHRHRKYLNINIIFHLEKSYGSAKLTIGKHGNKYLNKKLRHLKLNFSPPRIMHVQMFFVH